MKRKNSKSYSTILPETAAAKPNWIRDNTMTEAAMAVPDVLFSETIQIRCAYCGHAGQ